MSNISKNSLLIGFSIGIVYRIVPQHEYSYGAIHQPWLLTPDSHDLIRLKPLRPYFFQEILTPFFLVLDVYRVHQVKPEVDLRFMQFGELFAQLKSYEMAINQYLYLLHELFPRPYLLFLVFSLPFVSVLE